MYRILRSVLFLFDAEKVHHFTFSFLRIAGKIPGLPWLCGKFYRLEDPVLEKELFGLKFKNRIGVAAGFDKDARLINELSAFGFGCIEIGTLTPKPQSGNDKPRLFRLPSDEALINRMGFNNSGAQEAAARLAHRSKEALVGGNIGKNKLTPNESAVADYLQCVEILHPYVDYFVVNVSSPNTPGLRELQEREPLKKLLLEVKLLASSKVIPRPVLLKIAPDLSDSQLDDIMAILKETGTDGVIATNTTLSREKLTAKKDEIDLIGPGGVSGKPLRDRSTAVIRYLRAGLGPQFPIIGVGGIMTVDDAVEKITAGADLIQLYTGFIYQGPGFVKRINRKLRKELRSATRS